MKNIDRNQLVNVAGRYAFIVLTWNSEKYISDCLDSIDEAMAGTDTTVYVIDNGSTDHTVDYIRNWNNKSHNIKIDLTQLKKNTGTTVSRNIGLRKAINSSNYICVLDSDTKINKDAIVRLAEVVDTYKKVGIVGPVLKGLDGTIQNSGRAIPTMLIKMLKVMPFGSLRKKGENKEVIPKVNAITPVGYLMSACWFMRSRIVDDVGLLDEKIFYAPEDVEYCLRMWQNGYAVVYDKTVAITHAWQRLSRKKLISKHNYEHIKGLAYLFVKYKYLFNKKIDYKIWNK